MRTSQQYKEKQLVVINELNSALHAIDSDSVTTYLHALVQARKVFFVGVGRVLLSLQAIAKRYAHLGIDSVVVGQITEPAITAEDILIVGSGSGDTLFPVEIARKAKSFGAKVIHIGSNPTSKLTDIEDLFIRIPVKSRAKMKDEVPSSQPMTSLFEQALLLFGDITAMMLIEEKELSLEELWEYHANLE